MRKWRPLEASPVEVRRVVYQIEVPAVYRRDIKAIAHETHMAGHLGVNKTCYKMLSHFIGLSYERMFLSFASRAMFVRW